MKKIYSLLALPLVAATCLAGCGKTERSVEELTTLDNNIFNEYVANSVNTYFNETSKCFDVKYSIADITSRVEESNSNNINTNLKKRYSQLSTVYDRTITMSYAYYAEFKDVFYASIGDMDYEKDELSELYDKLKAFERQLDDFDNAKSNFEREVQLFGVDSEVLGATIDTFNTSYTAMIGKSLDLNNYFRDLHLKYFYAEPATVDSAYANRAYMDGVLTLANYVYRDYLVALEKNGATTTLVINNAVNNVYDRLNGVVKAVSNDVTALKTAFLDKFASTDEAVQKQAKDTIAEYEVALETFKQYYSLYEKVYDKVNMESHNNYRFATNGGYGSANKAQENYLNSLSTVDAANVRVLIDIEEGRVNDFINSITKLLSAN